MFQPNINSSLAYHLSTNLQAKHRHSCGAATTARSTEFISDLAPLTIDLNKILKSEAFQKEKQSQNESNTNGNDSNFIHSKWSTAEDFYDLDNYTPGSLKDSKPWKQNATYFQNVYISSVALMKMTIHADSGGDIEVMGMMIGKIIPHGMVIMDTYSLPVVGTETRVNAQSESYEFMVQYLDSLNKLGYRNENIIGWYHSHPGYGCWLSGIDVATESLNQTYQDPYLAIVIDPKKTKIDGKVEIGAFRTYPEENSNTGSNNKKQKQKQSKQTDTGDIALGKIPNSKLKDFGVHSSRYYSLNVSIFKSKYDESILRLLMNNYWVSGLTGLFDDEDDDGEDTNLLEKSEESTNAKMLSLLNKFDKSYEIIKSKLLIKSSKAISSLSRNLPDCSSGKSDKNKHIALVLPKSEKVKLTKQTKAPSLSRNTPSDIQLQQTLNIGSNNNNYKISERDYTVDIEVSDDNDDALSANSSSTATNNKAGKSVPILREDRLDGSSGPVDIRMKDADDDDNYENYGSVDSDTSIDNVSTFSSSSAVNSNLKPFGKSSSNYLKKLNSSQSLNVNSSNALTHSNVSASNSGFVNAESISVSGASATDISASADINAFPSTKPQPIGGSSSIGHKFKRQFEQQRQKRKDLLKYYESKREQDEEKRHLSIPGETSKAKDEDYIYQRYIQGLEEKKKCKQQHEKTRNNYIDVHIGQLNNQAKNLANEELRNSLSLKLQQELFF